MAGLVMSSNQQHFCTIVWCQFWRTLIMAPLQGGSIKHQAQDTPVDISDHINLQNIPGSICINWEQCSSAPAKLLLLLALWLLDTAVCNTSTLLPRCSTYIQGQTFAWNILSQFAVVSCKTAVAAVVLGAVLISARSRGAVSTVWRFEATIKPSKKCPDEFFMSI